jgi:hypothetical protein
MQWYRSKIDWWIALILGVPPVAALTVCVAFALAGRTAGLVVGLAMALFVLGL